MLHYFSIAFFCSASGCGGGGGGVYLRPAFLPSFLPSFLPTSPSLRASHLPAANAKSGALHSRKEEKKKQIHVSERVRTELRQDNGSYHATDTVTDVAMLVKNRRQLAIMYRYRVERKKGR